MAKKDQKAYVLYEEINGEFKKLIYITDSYEDMKKFINREND